MGQIKKA